MHDSVRQQYQAYGFAIATNILSVSDLSEVRNLLDPLFDRLDNLPTSIVNDLAGNGRPWQIPEINGTARVEPRLLGADDPAASALELIEIDSASAICCELDSGSVTLHHVRTAHATGSNDSADVRRMLRQRSSGSLSNARAAPVPAIADRARSGHGGVPCWWWPRFRR